jgi:hypothetical protein
MAVRTLNRQNKIDHYSTEKRIVGIAGRLPTESDKMPTVALSFCQVLSFSSSFVPDSCLECTCISLNGRLQRQPERPKRTRPPVGQMQKRARRGQGPEERQIQRRRRKRDRQPDRDSDSREVAE